MRHPIVRGASCHSASEESELLREQSCIRFILQAAPVRAAACILLQIYIHQGASNRSG
jgi:hypothetical protein